MSRTKMPTHNGFIERIHALGLRLRKGQDEELGESYFLYSKEDLVLIKFKANRDGSIPYIKITRQLESFEKGLADGMYWYAWLITLATSEYMAALKVARDFTNMHAYDTEPPSDELLEFFTNTRNYLADAEERLNKTLEKLPKDSFSKAGF